MKPPRTRMIQFPNVLIHAPESQVKRHPCYWDAKRGNADAAEQLVCDNLSVETLESLRRTAGEMQPILVSAHAYEQEGVNAIPEVLSDILSRRLGWPRDSNVVQTNVVAHTGSDGFSRLARQPAFDGPIQVRGVYVLVDDFVGMGGTLANLHGYIEWSGARVLAATVLTGKSRSARIQLSPDRAAELRRKHGPELEHWWQNRFGHAFDALTESEAGYLIRTPDACTIRDRIIAAEQAGNCESGG